MTDALIIVPCTIAEANSIIEKYHRHHPKVAGGQFAIGLAYKSLPHKLVGAAVCGRPVSRELNTGFTIEVNRTVVINGIKNGNSMLYGRAAQIARLMGYSRIITYTQEGETGASLRGAGWELGYKLPARKGWNSSSKPRDGNDNDNIIRYFWIKKLV